MKRNFLLLGIAAFALLFIFQSCKKDNLSDMEPVNQAPPRDMQAYDQFGASLESAVDKSLKDKAFKDALIKLTQERRMGDFEVLMTSFLDYETESGISIKEILLENAGNIFDEKQLDSFLDNYPSLVIATRGNIISWVKEEHTPPTVFVPSDFDEKAKEVTATQEGRKIQIRLDKRFKNAVIAMHISERHNQDGSPMILSHHTPSASSQTTRPGVNMSEDAGAGVRSSCPEPTSCTPPEVISFTAENINGGIQLTYNIDNFPASLCSWGRVNIRRIGPALPGGNGEPEIVDFTRFANQSNIFYDVTVSPNTQYIYQITARNVLINPNGNTPYWIICDGINTLEQTITSSESLPLLNTFRGRNQNNNTLLYNWYPLPGVEGVTQYRLNVLTDNGYETIVEKPANTGLNFHQYNHPTSVRGQMVEMQVQYQASAGWGGDFFDRSYASFRNPGEPLKYYGVKVPDAELYEMSSVGEVLLYGAPEVRMLAVRGAGSIDDRQTIIEQQTVIFMQNCTVVVQIGPFDFLVETDFYVPLSGEPVDIKSFWDPNLEGSAITVKLTETDVAEEVITNQTNETVWEVGINAEYGYKAGVDLFGLLDVGMEFAIGVEASYKASEEIEILYPVSDIEMDFFTIYYHYPYMLPHNSHLYGYLESGEGTDPCEIIPDYIRAR